MPSPSHADLEDAAKAFFQRLTEEGGMQRRGVLDDREIDNLLANSDDRMVELERQLKTNDFDLWVKQAAASMCDDAAVGMSELDDEGRMLASQLAARAERTKLASLVHALTTPGVTFVPEDDLFATRLRTQPPSPSRTVHAGPSIKTAAEEYERRIRNRNVGTSHITETIRVLRWLMEVHGADTPLSAITTDDLRTFRDNIDQSAVLRGKDVPFAHRRAKAPEERIKSATAIKYWGALRGFFRWAVEEKRVPEDPLGGLKIDRRKGEERASPEPFSSEELRQLFCTPLYAGHRARTRVNEPGSIHTRNGKWWSLILLLHTGMRAGEVAQLLPSDFKFDDPVPHIKVRETDDDGKRVKSLKTKASIRDVPIHPNLIELGLRQFVERRAKAYPSRQVFWDFRPGADGRKSDGLTKFWGAYLRKHGLWKPGRATHVGRHTLTALLRQAFVSDDDIGAIIGHAARTMTSTYGGAYPLTRKVASLGQLDFGFDVVGVLGGPFDAKKHGE